MLGTSANAWGGIASVISAYQQSALFERYEVIHLSTHCNGNLVKKLSLLVRTWLKFNLILLTKKIAFVHIHTAGKNSFWRKILFAIPAIYSKVGIILHIHASGFPSFYDSCSSRFGRIIIRFILNKSRCVLVVSKVLQSWVCAVSTNPVVIVMPNPAFLPAWPGERTRATNEVLFLGKIDAKKGTLDLLHALREILIVFPNTKLILAGNGNDTLVRNTARSLDIDRNVEFRNWVSGYDKLQLLNRATVFVLPSYAEGMPMSVLEAMLSGLVVIATDVGGIPELISHGVEGLLFRPGDVRALRIALDTTLSDKNLRYRMGEAGRLRATTEFSISSIIARLEILYSELEGSI